MSDILTAEEARKIATPSIQHLVEIACNEIKKAAFNGENMVEIKSELIQNIRFFHKEQYMQFVEAMIKLGYKYQGWWTHNRERNYTKFYY